MKRRAAALSCVLWLGCGASSTVPVADGGKTSEVSDAGMTPASRSTVRPMDAASGIPDAARSEARDASASDAAAPGPGGLIPVQRIYPDGGEPPPEPPDTSARDAGQPAAADADGGEPEQECNAARCWCEQMCERGLSLECPADGSMETCVAQCDVPSSDCYEYFLRVLSCKAGLPGSAYSCDPDLLVFVIGGCVAQEQALQECRRF